MAAASPSLPEAVATTVAEAASALVAIPVPSVGVVSEVTLMAPPSPATAEEERETGLPALPDGGLHGSPAWTELKAPR